MKSLNPIILAIVAVVMAGCALDKLGPAHPVDGLDYPVGVTADPGGEVIWVTSGNFDLAHEGGAVLGIDLKTHTFIPGAVAEIGSFPGSVHLLSRNGTSAHAYVVSRTTDELFHLTVDWSSGKPQLGCDGGQTDASGLVRCTMTGLKGEEDTEPDDEISPPGLGQDPFGILIHPSRTSEEPDLLFSAAMGDGTLATFVLDADGVPSLAGNLSLDIGLFALAQQPKTGQIYASSKGINSVSVLEVHDAPNDTSESPYISKMSSLVLPAMASTNHARDLALSSDGQKLYVLHQAPASIIVVDVSGGIDSSPNLLAKIPLDRSPGEIAVVPSYGDPTAGGLPELIYVSCFDKSRIDVVDPSAGQVVATIRTGRGPYGMAFVHNVNLGIRRLYVVNFHSHSVGVVELDPNSPYFHQQVAEIR
jgi:DNA-binding beta-propeller fold protein YncE